jgi:EAL domain-containing protein (putative c-di-GMP-specific phosphodiesterase class I)
MEWQHAFPMQPPLMLAVNLSGRQLQDPTFVEDVRAILRASGLPATSLKLEITESLAVADTAGNRRALNELRHMGVRLAIDDFGTGTSAIDYLRRDPVDALKIDRSFIVELGHDERTTAVVRAIIAFGSSLGLSVTAEGIETVEQSAQLRAMGCEWGQGYLFARPMQAERIADVLQRADLPAAA